MKQPNLTTITEMATLTGLSKKRVRTFLQHIGHGVQPIGMIGRTGVFTPNVRELVVFAMRYHTAHEASLCGHRGFTDAQLKELKTRCLERMVLVYLEQGWTPDGPLELPARRMAALANAN